MLSLAYICAAERALERGFIIADSLGPEKVFYMAVNIFLNRGSFGKLNVEISIIS